MKRLNYLDYVKTPSDWKEKALNIPNMMECEKNEKKSHNKIYRPSAILVACIVALSISGVGVYAVESGAIDNFLKNSWVNYIDRVQRYSYSGTYNDTIKDAKTFITENINTDIQVDNVQCSNGVTLDIKGMIYYSNTATIIADVTIPNLTESFALYDNTQENNINKLYSNADIYKQGNRQVNQDGYIINNICGGVDIASKPIDDTITVVMDVYFYNENANNQCYTVKLENIDYYKDGELIVLSEFTATADITFKKSSFVQEVNNVDKTIQIGDKYSAHINKVEYSPLSVDIYFDNTNFVPNDGNDDGIYNELDYGIYTNLETGELDINAYYTYRQKTDIRKNYINVYYIYADGRRVFASRDNKYLITDENGVLTSLKYDYYRSNSELIDCSNMVAIEINGEVIPLK
ncbi:MAG: hypothetical protein ACI4WH_04275 [Oscillospiraceae bacterium]